MRGYHNIPSTFIYKRFEYDTISKVTLSMHLFTGGFISCQTNESITQDEEIQTIMEGISNQAGQEKILI